MLREKYHDSLMTQHKMKRKNELQNNNRVYAVVFPKTAAYNLT